MDMILYRSGSAEIVAQEAQVFLLLSPGSGTLSVMLENQDLVDYIQYRFQVSPDNLNWTSMVDDSVSTSVSGNYGTNLIMAPQSVAMASIRTTAPYVRLLAKCPGGGRLVYGITQFTSSTSTTFTNGVQ